MKKRIIYISLIIILILLITISFIYNILQKPDNTNAILCRADSDCIKVQTTCCACSSGGEEKCVLKAEEINYTLKLSDCPKRNLCAQVYNCKDSNCQCINGECK